MDNLFTNHECPSCRGQGWHQDGGNIWECEDCSGKGIVSSAYIVWASEFAAKTKAEAEASILKLCKGRNTIFYNSRLARHLLFQRRILKPPLTYVWWRRATPENSF